MERDLYRPPVTGGIRCFAGAAAKAAPRRGAANARLGGVAPGGYALGMFGFLNVNKPTGPTSFAAVAAVRRRLARGVKVGHAGTLDPFARGVLVVCVGPATRLVSIVQAMPKRYRAEIMLGATSTTDDVEGEIAPVASARAPDESAVMRAVGPFVGPIQQVPPAFSAVHVNGTRAYKLARTGRMTHLPAREVIVHAIDIVRYAYPRLELDVRCGSGTYIRSLARDIGAALATGGYCTALTRTEVGPFTLADAVELDQADPAAHLVHPLAALADMPKATLDAAQTARIAMGQPLGRDELAPEPAPDADRIALVDAQGSLLAIAAPSPDGGAVRPVKVFITR